MARIETYVNDTNVTIKDKVIGTDDLNNSTKNFTVGDMLNLTGSILTAGTGIDITGNTISCTVVDTNDVDYIDSVTLNGTDLDFTSVGNGFSGTIDLSNLATASFTAGNGITITNGVIEVSAIGAYSYIDNVTLSGTDLIFAGLGAAYGGTIDLSGFVQTASIAGGQEITVSYNPANGITTVSHDSITVLPTTTTGTLTHGGTFDVITGVTTNGVGHIVGYETTTFTMPTGTSVNTTYDLGAVGAAGNIYLAMTGSDGTNDTVGIQAGANITLTDNGSNTFTIDATGGVTTLSGLIDTTITTPANNDVLTYNGSAWVNSPGAPQSAPEKLILQIDPRAYTVGGSSDVLFADITGSLPGSIHVSPTDLAPQAGGGLFPFIDVNTDSTVRLAIGAFINATANNSRFRVTLFENTGGGATPIGEAVFDFARAATHPATFFSYFALKAGATYFFSADAIDATCEILPGSVMEFEIL